MCRTQHKGCKKFSHWAIKYVVDGSCIMKKQNNSGKNASVIENL